MPVINTTRRTADAGEIGGPVKKPATQSRPTTSSKPATSVIPRSQPNTGGSTSASKAPTTVVDFRGGANTSTPTNNTSVQVSNSLSSKIKPGNATSTIGKSPAPKAEIELRSAVNNSAGDSKTAKKVIYAEVNWDDEETSSQKYTVSSSSVNPWVTNFVSDPLNTTLALLQGAILDRNYDVNLLGGAGMRFTDWMAWSPEQINVVFQSITQTAAYYNQLAQIWNVDHANSPSQQIRYEGAAHLFREMNGPMVFTLHNAEFLSVPGDRSSWLSRLERNMVTTSDIDTDGDRLIDHNEDGTPRSPDAPLESTINISGAAFRGGSIHLGLSGLRDDQNTRSGLMYDGRILVTHEIVHILDYALNDGLTSYYEEHEIFGDYEIGMSNIGARSSGSVSEIVGDAVTNSIWGTYDYSNLDAFNRDAFVRSMITQAIVNEFLEER
ncbi:MAG: hypothetical protein IAE89_04435 [Anaerolineae bacterium]|nr:hypothetical protein [Anaerolineae bacterium]